MDLFQILVNEDQDIQDFEVSNIFWEPQIVFSVDRRDRKGREDDDRIRVGKMYKIKPSLFQPFVDKKPAEQYALKDSILYVYRGWRFLKTNLRVTLILFRDGVSAARRNFNDRGILVSGHLLDRRGIFVQQFISDIENYGYIYYWNSQFMEYDGYPDTNKLYEDLIMILRSTLQRIQFVGTTFEQYYYDYVEDNKWIASGNQVIPDKINKKIKLNLVNDVFYANIEKVNSIRLFRDR